MTENSYTETNEHDINKRIREMEKKIDIMWSHHLSKLHNIRTNIDHQHPDLNESEREKLTRRIYDWRY